MLVLHRFIRYKYLDFLVVTCSHSGERAVSFKKKLSLPESLFTVPSIVLQSIESWLGGLGRVSERGNDTAKACSLTC